MYIERKGGGMKRNKDLSEREKQSFFLTENQLDWHSMRVWFISIQFPASQTFLILRAFHQIHIAHEYSSYNQSDGGRWKSELQRSTWRQIFTGEPLEKFAKAAEEKYCCSSAFIFQRPSFLITQFSNDSNRLRPRGPSNRCFCSCPPTFFPNEFTK